MEWAAYFTDAEIFCTDCERCFESAQKIDANLLQVVFSAFNGLKRLGG